MAREIVTRLVDDLDQSEAASTVRFGWQGASYEIDLSEKNATAFEDALARYLQAARRVSGRGRQPAGRGARRGRRATRPARALTGIREWATNHGYTVAARGRIPAAVVEAYQSAQAVTGGEETVAATAGKAAPRKAATSTPAKKNTGRKTTARPRTPQKGNSRRRPAKKSSSTRTTA
jgi:hypothetical protein